jgi:hypothetical protein
MLSAGGASLGAAAKEASNWIVRRKNGGWRLLLEVPGWVDFLGFGVGVGDRGLDASSFVVRLGEVKSIRERAARGKSDFYVW